MARSATLWFAIAASLALPGCQTPQRAPETGQKATAPNGVLAPSTDSSATTRPAAPAQLAPATAPAKQAPAQPSAPSPSAPGAPSAAKASAPNASAPAKQAASQPAASAPKAQPAASAPKAQPATATPKSPLDLNSLEQRLKDTRAIGVFTKLSLKNQVDDLLSEFRAFHQGAAKTAQSELRQKFDLLIMKVLSLLQNGDPQLASAIASSRDAIWGILIDPKKFAGI